MDADQIVDRRRLRRKLSFWRVAAFVLLVAAAGAIAVAVAGPERLGGRFAPHVARIKVDGFIGNDRDQLALIEKLGDSRTVKAVIVSINSTGGSTTGGEGLYEALRALSKKKPTVATLGTVAASAAYMTAIGTERIVARRNTITGSIGVIFESPQIAGLMDKLGIAVTEIKSAPLKAEPSPFREPSAEAKAVIQAMIDDAYGWFVDIVAERRGLDRPTALKLADGRVYTGNQALQVKLVDELGDEDTARAWLAKAKDVSEALPVRDYAPARDSGPFNLGSAAALWIARQLGLPADAGAALGLDRLLPRSLQLDGLLSVWQGSGDLHDGAGASR